MMQKFKEEPSEDEVTGRGASSNFNSARVDLEYTNRPLNIVDEDKALES